jgi:hypothetical protein
MYDKKMKLMPGMSPAMQGAAFSGLGEEHLLLAL